MNRLLLIYTGDGKGKTTAALGSALRAWGHGARVLVVQFLKGFIESGEQRIANENFEVSIVEWKGFVTEVTEEVRRRFAAGLEAARKKIAEKRPDFVVLDELCVALMMGLCGRSDAEKLINEARKSGCVVVTGRGCPQWLLDAADTVTEIKEEAHPFRRGQKARPGIEF